MVTIQRGKAEAIEIKRAQRGQDRRQYRRGKTEAIEINRAQRGDQHRTIQTGKGRGLNQRV